LADVDLVTLPFLIEDLILLPSCPGLSSRILVEKWLQEGSEPAVLMFVGAVVVALVWSFRALPIVSSILTCLDLMFV
jgi:hypothetical protein